MKTGDAYPTVLYGSLKAYAIRPYVLFSSDFYFLFSLRDTIHEILDTNKVSIFFTIYYILYTVSLSSNSYLLSREGFDVEFHPERLSGLLIVYSYFTTMEVPGNSHHAISELKII